MPLSCTKHSWWYCSRALRCSGYLVLLSLSLAQAQTVITQAQQKRIDRLYQRFQQEVLALPMKSVACPAEAFEQAKAKQNFNAAYWYEQVKWLERNGGSDCAAQLMRKLRPEPSQKDAYMLWLLKQSQWLRSTDHPDSAQVVLRQLEELHPQQALLQGLIKYEQAALYRRGIQFEKALQTANEALQLARKARNALLEYKTLGEIGKTSRDIYRQEPSKYLGFFEQALKAAQAIGDSTQLLWAYQDLVYVYFFDDTFDVDHALDHFEQSMAYFSENRSLFDRYAFVHTFADMLGYLPSEHLKVKNLYRSALPITRKLRLPKSTRTIYIYLASTHVQQREFVAASAYLDSAQALDSPEWEKDNFWAQRGEVAGALGNLPLANKYYQKALEEKERVYLRRNNQSMTQWETQFRTREKELQIEQQQRQQLLLWGIVALITMMFGLALFFFFRNRRQLHQLAAQKAIIEQQTEELRSLDKAKTRFFSNITHEFRTPLTLILSPLEGLMRELPLQASLRTIHANANRLLLLINQLLDLSKIDAGALKPNLATVQLSSFIQLQVEAFALLAQNRGVDLVLLNHLSPDAEGYIDEDKLSKIITNLLSNALKFTPEGHTVRVEAELAPEALLELRISDTGIGIPPEQLASIFDRFYQVDSTVRRSFEGSGIGLSLVKELVEVLKGNISATSQVNVGTTFRLTLPVGASTWADSLVQAEGPTAHSHTWVDGLHSEAQELAVERISGSKPILLVVEDNADLRSYISGLFVENFEVLSAINGVEGLAKAFETSPDLVITDWMMPEMDGLSMCQQLKADVRSSHVPVIMLTAKSAIESRLEGFEGGADDYLVKPFHAHELQLKVRNWLQRQERLREHYRRQLAETQEKPPTPAVEAAFMERIFQTIDEHLADASFGVEHLAERLQLNRRTLQRKIQSITDLSPNELIRNHRLRRALPLLRRGENIADVAFRVGFENPSYFTKCFKETFGKRPSDLADAQSTPKG